MQKTLTESLEDYLEAIAELSAVEDHAHTRDIAARLQVKMPSVTGALRQLAKMGYIVYKTHYPVTLTPKGKLVAENIASRHQVLKRFFVDILGMLPENASEAACHLEHLVDETAVNQFKLFSEAITTRTDARKHRIFLSDAMELGADCRTLNTLKTGESALVRRIGRNISLDAPLEHYEGSELRLELPSPMQTPDKLVELAELRSKTAKAMQALPESYRNAVLLRNVRHLDYDQIAAILGCPVGTVKSRINRGREMLRQMLEL